MPLPITTSFCLGDPAVISRPDRPTATVGDQEGVRRFPDGVTTTAPGVPEAARSFPALPPTIASAADGRQSSLTGLLLAIDMPMCDRSEWPEILRKVDSH